MQDRQKQLNKIANVNSKIIKQPTTQMAYNAYQQKSVTQLMAYLHACMNDTVVKTYINANRKGWLATFPGLTVETVQ